MAMPNMANLGGQGYSPVQSFKMPKQAGFFESYFKGTSPSVTQISKFNPQQQDVMSKLLQQLQGNQFDFDPIEQQARTGFQQKTLPSIKEMFTSMGAGSQGSGAFARALGGAGAGLEESLAGMKQQYGLQQRGQNLQFGMQQPFDTMQQEGSTGYLQNMFSKLMSGGLDPETMEMLAKFLPMLMGA